jgi:hypothetical protein
MPKSSLGGAISVIVEELLILKETTQRGYFVYNMLMIGPPSSGKTMPAQRLSTILPPLSFDEALEISRIFRVVGLLQGYSLMTR